MFIPAHSNFSYVWLQISLFSNDHCRLVVEVGIKDKESNSYSKI